MRRAP